jgi:hypothetical protein
MTKLLVDGVNGVVVNKTVSCDLQYLVHYKFASNFIRMLLMCII